MGDPDPDRMPVGLGPGAGRHWWDRRSGEGLRGGAAAHHIGRDGNRQARHPGRHDRRESADHRGASVMAHVAYVDYDKATGKYWACFNGKSYGPYDTYEEAWAKLRELGA